MDFIEEMHRYLIRSSKEPGLETKELRNHAKSRIHSYFRQISMHLSPCSLEICEVRSWKAFDSGFIASGPC